MQKSCAKTGGGVGDSPSEVLNPDELNTAEADTLMSGGAGLLNRPIQPQFSESTKKRPRTVGSFPFFTFKYYFLQIFKPRKCNIIIRWSPKRHQTTLMLVT